MLDPMFEKTLNSFSSFEQSILLVHIEAVPKTTPEKINATVFAF